MRFLSIVFILGFGLQLSAQQECKTNLFLEATLYIRANDTAASVRKDTAKKKPLLTFEDYTAVANYVLKPPAPAYEIVSFTVVTEEDEYINEVPCQGNIISLQAERIIYQRKRGTPVYFTCIKVKHPNGKIYILKDLTVNFP